MLELEKDKIIARLHSALQDYNDINTYSEGEEPFRRVVVSIKR